MFGTLDIMELSVTDGLARAKRSLEMVKWLVNNNARQKDSFKNSSLVHFPIFSCRFHYDFVKNNKIIFCTNNYCK